MCPAIFVNSWRVYFLPGTRLTGYVFFLVMFKYVFFTMKDQGACVNQHRAGAPQCGDHSARILLVHNSLLHTPSHRDGVAELRHRRECCAELVCEMARERFAVWLPGRLYFYRCAVRKHANIPTYC